MYLLLLGLALLLLKYLQVEPVVAWDWWWLLSPLGAAVLWWWWADHFGYTRHQASMRMDQRKRKRLDASRRRLGLPPLDRR